jgi:integrase
VRFLRPDEATRLLAACQKSRNAALIDLVEFAMFTGVRRGEALGLTWDRVDRARGVVLLTETKNGRPREVQLSANADAALARRWTANATGPVFGSRNWNSFRQASVAAVKAAGIARFRFHDLRHTTASWLVQRGRSLREVELLGHSDIQITSGTPTSPRTICGPLWRPWTGILSPASAEAPAGWRRSVTAQGRHKNFFGGLDCSVSSGRGGRI